MLQELREESADGHVQKEHGQKAVKFADQRRGAANAKSFYGQTPAPRFGTLIAGPGGQQQLQRNFCWQNECDSQQRQRDRADKEAAFKSRALRQALELPQAAEAVQSSSQQALEEPASAAGRALQAEPAANPGPALQADPAANPRPALPAEPAANPGPALQAEPAANSRPALSAEPAANPGPAMQAEPAANHGPALQADPAANPRPAQHAEVMDKSAAVASFMAEQQTVFRSGSNQVSLPIASFSLLGGIRSWLGYTHL